MPTYAYECKTCKHNFDVFQKMSDDPVKKCPECGKAVRRLIHGGTGVIFKGGGFYNTDRSIAKGASIRSSREKEQSDGEAPAACNTACEGCPAAASASDSAASTDKRKAKSAAKTA